MEYLWKKIFSQVVESPCNQLIYFKTNKFLHQLPEYALYMATSAIASEWVLL